MAVTAANFLLNRFTNRYILKALISKAEGKYKMDLEAHSAHVILCQKTYLEKVLTQSSLGTDCAHHVISFL